jgi:hypothetical protein
LMLATPKEPRTELQGGHGPSDFLHSIQRNDDLRDFIYPHKR